MSEAKIIDIQPSAEQVRAEWNAFIDQQCVIFQQRISDFLKAQTKDLPKLAERNPHQADAIQQIQLGIFAANIEYAMGASGQLMNSEGVVLMHSIKANTLGMLWSKRAQREAQRLEDAAKEKPRIIQPGSGLVIPKQK